MGGGGQQTIPTSPSTVSVRPAPRVNPEDEGGEDGGTWSVGPFIEVGFKEPTRNVASIIVERQRTEQEKTLAQAPHAAILLAHLPPPLAAITLNYAKDWTWPREGSARVKTVKKGDRVLAMDYVFKWYNATIAEEKAGYGRVEFDGWGRDWDEWIPLTSFRFRAELDSPGLPPW